MRVIALSFVVCLILVGCGGGGGSSFIANPEAGAGTTGPVNVFAMGPSLLTTETWVIAQLINEALDYKLYESTDNVTWSLARSTAVTSEDINARAGVHPVFRVAPTTSKFYRMTVVRADGESNPSNSVYFDATRRAAALAGFNVTWPVNNGDVVNDSLELQNNAAWTAAAGATRYLVYTRMDSIVGGFDLRQMENCWLSEKTNVQLPVVWMLGGGGYNGSATYTMIVVAIDANSLAIGYALREFKGPTAP